MGMSDEKNRERNLEKNISHLKEQHDVLRVICGEADSIELPAEHRDIVFFQRAAARYGRDFMKFNIEWYEKLLSEISEDARNRKKEEPEVRKAESRRSGK